MSHASNMPSQSNPELLSELFNLLKPHLAELDGFLKKQINSFEEEIREHVAYCIDTSGKRIRPSLIFFSGWSGDQVVNDKLVKLAAVIEIVHLATLVHDDVMDEADMRRNRPTVAKIQGNSTAVLIGDALFSHAVYLATQFPTSEVSEYVATAMRNVCTGEILQTMKRGDPDISRDNYQRIIDLKTAELFQVACFLGARLANRSEAFVQAVRKFGRHLGIAYQIYDDLTDLVGSEEKVGKTLGTDIATGKATLPIILLRDRLTEGEEARLRQALSGKGDVDIDFWLSKLSETGVVSDVRDAIFREIETAREGLGPFSGNRDVELLGTLSELLWNQVDVLQSRQVGT